MDQHPDPYIRSLDVASKRVRESPLAYERFDYVAVVKDKSETTVNRLHALTMFMISILYKDEEPVIHATNVYLANRWFKELIKAFLDEFAPGKTLIEKLKINQASEEESYLTPLLVKFVDMPRMYTIEKGKLDNDPSNASFRFRTQKRLDDIIDTASPLVLYLQKQARNVVDRVDSEFNSFEAYRNWKVGLDTDPINQI